MKTAIALTVGPMSANVVSMRPPTNSYRPRSSIRDLSAKRVLFSFLFRISGPDDFPLDVLCFWMFEPWCFLEGLFLLERHSSIGNYGFENCVGVV